MITGCRILGLNNNDISEIINIEKELYSFPWSRNTFLDAIKNNHSWKIIEKNILLGYFIFSHFNDQCDILNLSIDKKYQKKGYGCYFLKYLINNSHLNLKKILLEVRQSNIIALSFYKKNNFSKIGCRKNFYRTLSGRENAVIMERVL